MTVTDITSIHDFNGHLDAAGSMAVLIFFTSVTCGPCRLINPHVEKLSNAYEDKIVFLRIDVDEVADVAQQQMIASSLPTFSFFRNGDVLESFVGADLNKLKIVCEKYANA